MPVAVVAGRAIRILVAKAQELAAQEVVEMAARREMQTPAPMDWAAVAAGVVPEEPAAMADRA